MGQVPFLLLLLSLFVFSVDRRAIALPLHSPTLTTTATTNASDALALLSFKSMLHNASFGALASWNDSLRLCRWPGVTCGARRHRDRVTALDLESLHLTGPLSPSLSNLTFIRRIHLPGNQLQGHIPEELGRLFRLQHLNLSTNSLQGSLPTSILNCSDLRNISLRSNKLQGVIQFPPKLPPLINLDLSNNMFIGSIPPSLGNMSALNYLDLSNNNLTGSIPSLLERLSFLIVFDLSRNSLAGEVPMGLWNLSSLTKFEVHTNNLSGTLPPDLGTTLPNLQRLLLYENQFTGPIPISISNASGLEHIELYYNELTGTIPWDLGTLRNLSALILGNNQLEAKEDKDWRFFTGLVNCSRLQTLDVSNNMLGGVLPDAITNLSRGLVWLGMMGNQIQGRIPPEIANLVSLTELRMKDNLFTGHIPATMGKFPVLQELHLSGNMFSGEIPPDLGNLTQLNLLYLESNHLSGNIPKTLGNCKELLLLNLGYNNLTGSIPIEIITMSTLSIYLSFANNSLTGSLPSEVERLINLDALDISNNKLSGEIPSTLGECSVMEYLFMEGNFFQGSIPSSLSGLKGLVVLDLSRNNLSGQVPEFLTKFYYLENLNLSFNNFQGKVPEDGVLSNDSIISVFGNNHLCGGSPGLHLPPCPEASRKNHSSSKLKEIIPIVTVVVFVVLLGCSLIACYYIKKLRRSSPAVGNTDPSIISYSELLNATDGFSTTNLIGVGSFGSVYKAIMDIGDIKIVAVKVIDHQQRGASKSFLSECDALRNIRHRNLVKILTVCSSVDSRGNDFRALIFEFMPNGSLHEWLHEQANGQPGLKKLSLIQRLNIAIDVASALDYLHHYGGVPIVHCDLKPSNVLLDDDMVARVGDFGLARFLDKTSSKTSDQASTSSTGLKGTIGYVAPEYGMANKVSPQGDVYSYGVLLLEMFTGRRPTDHAFTEGLSLRKFVEMAFAGRIMDIVDTRLFIEEDEEDSDDNQGISDERWKVYECVASMLRIGLACTEELPSERIEMGDVTKEVMAAKEAFLRGEIKGEKRYMIPQ